MNNQEILYDVTDRVATITLNRPDKLNAWTARMYDEVRDAMYSAESDENVRAIILTGAGRGFCAGADMSLLSGIAEHGLADGSHPLSHSSNPTARDGFPADFQRKYSYFPSIRKPVIAAINGPAIGLGFIISLYCDLRFASTDARFGTAFARRGLIAEYGIAWMLPRLIGPANALDLLLSARIIGAADAHRIGLVNGVFAAGEFMERVREYAKELATMSSPRSTAIIKAQVYSGLFQTLEEATVSAEQAMVESLQCEDFKEGVAHFLEKRMPVFTGR
jgi:enoyl-CoA hydratase/carnithine racemase